MADLSGDVLTLLGARRLLRQVAARACRDQDQVVRKLSLPPCLRPFLAAALWVFAITVAAAEHALQLVRADGVTVYFQVEEARTQAQRTRGLMFVQQLPARSGMWFDFVTEQHLSMWMKNTELPLDMLFVDQHGVIQHIHKSATPHDLTPISSSGAVRYVLELNAGEVQRYALNIGDQVIRPVP